MTLVVRDSEPGDEFGVARVHVDSWQKAYAGLMPDEVLDDLSIESRARGWGRAIRVNPGNGWRLRIAERECDIVGWAVISHGRDPGHAPEWGELEGFYAHPDSWGTGVGRALMTDAVELLRAAGHTHAYLWVLAGNDRTIAIYEHFGWRLDGQTKTERLSVGLEVRELRMTLELGSAAL